jgi:hypothetical protein
MNIVTTMEDMPLTLEQRLARFDPERHSGEVMAVGEYVGREALTYRFGRHDDQSSLTPLISPALGLLVVVGCRLRVVIDYCAHGRKLMRRQRSSRETIFRTLRERSRCLS